MHGSRGFISLPWVLALAVLLALLGAMSSAQVSAVRQNIERIQALRLVDLASASAFEEVSALLQEELKGVAPPSPTLPRDLRADRIKPPRTIEPALTRASLAGAGVEVSSVHVESSPWRRRVTQTDPSTTTISEAGILEYTVHVHVVAGSIVLNQIVVTRRFAEVAPDPGGGARIRIRATPLMRKVM
jgi:hypothetical protein